MTDATRILWQIEQGDTSAADELLRLVYDELRRLAGQRMAQEAVGHSLQPTALVHEAYVRLVDQTVPPQWDGRGHFFAAAAESFKAAVAEDSTFALAYLRLGDTYGWMEGAWSGAQAEAHIAEHYYSFDALREQGLDALIDELKKKNQSLEKSG